VACLAYSETGATGGGGGVVLSADVKGVIELWDGITLGRPALDRVRWSSKTQTDLFTLAKGKRLPCTAVFAPNGERVAIRDTGGKTAVFDVATGKQVLEVDDGAAAVAA